MERDLADAGDRHVQLARRRTQDARGDLHTHGRRHRDPASVIRERRQHAGRRLVEVWINGRRVLTEDGCKSLGMAGEGCGVLQAVQQGQ